MGDPRKSAEKTLEMVTDFQNVTGNSIICKNNITWRDLKWWRR